MPMDTDIQYDPNLCICGEIRNYTQVEPKVSVWLTQIHYHPQNYNCTTSLVNSHNQIESGPSSILTLNHNVSGGRLSL